MLSVLWLAALAFAVDADNDGFDSVQSGGTDCDDTNALVNPGAPEVCQIGAQIDDDCDGNPNTQAGMYARSEQTLLGNMSASRPYFEDWDGDGFSDIEANTPIYLCRAGVAEQFFSYRGGDCDDDDPSINPDAAEVCNVKDDDCNGEIDDIEGERPGTEPVFRDDDADGYGRSDDSRLMLCSSVIQDLVGASTDPDSERFLYQSNYYTLVDGDCDDEDDETFPRDGDYVEKIDGRDNDCDGRVSVGELDCDQDGACPEPLEFDCRNTPSPNVVTCGNEQLSTVCNGLTGQILVETSQLPGLYREERRIDLTACSAVAFDCDDNDAGRSFGEAELCDGFDTSCAGTEGLPIDADGDGVSDANQGGIAGRTTEQLLDTDNDGYADACIDDGPARFVNGSGPDYPAPSVDFDEDSDSTPDDVEPSGCSCDSAPVWPMWSLLGVVVVAVRRRR